MSNRSAIFSSNTPGGPQNIVDIANHPYDVYFIDSSNDNASDAAGYGNSPDIPIASIDYLFTLATANKKVIGYVLPGHIETYSTTGTKVTGDIAGVHIKGLGQGSNRPTITFSHADATWAISGANITIENILFVAGIDSITTYGTISGNDCKMIDCETRDTTDIEVIDGFKITGDRFECKRHFHNGYSSGDENARVFSLNGVESAIFEDCVFYTKVTTAVIGMVSNASNNVIVKNSSFYVAGTSDFSKTVVDEITGSTWEVTNCFDIAAGSTFSGGSGSALAAIDTTGLAAAIAVVDGFHDVPGVDSANNNQIRDVVGNKTDTANATGSLVRMIKHIISLIGTPAGADTAADIAAIKTVVDTIATYVDTEVSVIDAYHDVPTQNTANNNQMRDVIGNKTDTAGAGDSIVALIKIADEAIDAIQTDLGDPSSRTNLQTIVAMLGNPDTANQSIWDCLAGTGGISSFPAGANPANDVSIAEVLRDAWDNIGDAKARTNLQSLVAMLGNPDTANQSIWDCLAGTGGIASFPAGAAAANDVSIAEVLRYIQENIQNGGTVLPASQSIFDLLAGTNGIDTFPAGANPANNVSIAEVLRDAWDNIGDAKARTNLQSLVAMLGNPDTANQSIWDCLAGTGGIASFPVGAAPANDISLAEVLRDIWDAVRNGTGGSEPGTNLSIVDELKRGMVHYNNPDYIAVTADLESGTWNTQTTHEVFTVTGLVRMRICIEVTETGDDTSGNTSNIQFGVEGTTNAWIAATEVDDLDTGEIWIDATPTEKYGDFSSMVFDKVVNGLDVGYEITGEAATDGIIVFHCVWEPINSTGNVVAGAGGAL